jgi:hypothetical protein
MHAKICCTMGHVGSIKGPGRSEMLCSWDPSVWDDSVQTSPVWPLGRNEQVISRLSQEQRRIAQEIQIQGSRFQDNLGKDMSSVVPEACLFDEPCLAGAALMILRSWSMAET